MSARKPTATHPAVASAARAIRRNLPHLTPEQLFRLAAVADSLRYGEDRGRWELSAQHVAAQAAHGRDTMRKTVRTPSLDDERAERLARIDTTTLSAPELELIEAYRAMSAPMLGALLTITRLAKSNDRPEGR